MLSAAFKVVAGIAVVAALGVAHEWKADLTPAGESGISGTATVNTGTPPTADTTKPAAAPFKAQVSIMGAKDGDTHPWHLHSGTCGSKDAPIVGAASDYAAIKVGSSGEGKAMATVNEALAGNGQYLVNVHKSADDLTVVSCGQLKMTGVTGTMPTPLPPR